MTLTLPPGPLQVGLMGGTFDPIHLGHLAAARAARDCARLDLVLLVPAGIPPHRAAAVATPEERLEMCRLAVASEPGLGVWEVEVRRRDRPSYTIDTIREFQRRRPLDTPHLVLGWDAAREIRTWREPDRVVAAAPCVVVARPGAPPPSESDLREAGLDSSGVVVCREPTPDIEATEIRRLAAAGALPEGMVPVAVARYIAGRRLYSA